MARMATDTTSRKVMASTAGAAAATILIYAFEALTGTVLPEPVSGAVSVIVVYLAGYYTPPAVRDQVVAAATD